LLVIAPHPHALLRLVSTLMPVIHQDVQHDVFGHPHGEIRIDDPYHRRAGQLRVG
jgi:hypothetical protein